MEGFVPAKTAVPAKHQPSTVNWTFSEENGSAQAKVVKIFKCIRNINIDILASGYSMEM